MITLFLHVLTPTPSTISLNLERNRYSRAKAARRKGQNTEEFEIGTAFKVYTTEIFVVFPRHVIRPEEVGNIGCRTRRPTRRRNNSESFVTVPLVEPISERFDALTRLYPNRRVATL